MKQCPACKSIVKDNLLFCAFDGQTLVTTTQSDGLTGTVLDDKYRLEQIIGTGGMGKVYMATHLYMDNTVAIKILDPRLSSNENALKRFRQEAQASASIKHSNIVGVTDFGVTKDTGIAYLVMEFLEGMELRERIDQQKQLDYKEIYLIVQQTCAALHTAHSKDIIHRDLKPDNIWLIRSEIGANRVKVLDFGIAKLKSSPASSKLTEIGTVIGTPSYMSPEQFHGEELGAQSDIYSLGVIIYEMLTGHLPFQGPNPMEVAIKHTSEAPKPLCLLRSDIPKPLEKVVLRALSKRPGDRQQSALELAKEFRASYKEAGIDTEFSAVGTGQLTADWIREVEAKTGKTELPQLDAVSEEPPGSRAASGTACLMSEPQHEGETATPAFSGDHYPAARPESKHEPAISSPPVISTEPLSAESSTGQHGATVALGHSAAEPDRVIATRRRPSPAHRGRVWWVLGGAVAVAIVALLLLSPTTRSKGFTLVIQGAPSGSMLYLNGVPAGVVPQTGVMRLSQLEADKSTEVRIVRDGYEEFIQTIAGEEGEEQVLSAQLKPREAPMEIDYQGLMVLVQAGPFIMGDDSRLSDEGPAQTIELPAYYIDKFEVTNAQYKQFCDATGWPYPTDTQTNRDYFNNNPDSPVVGVSWFDASSFAQWAGKRLPTEEEWEKAASWDSQTGSKRQWPWGDEADPNRANFTGNPYPVGSFPDEASAYGVYDMAGNAAEWVNSFYQAYPGNTTQDSNFGNKYRVVRGGSYKSEIADGRTTYRDFQSPDVEERVTNGKEQMTAVGFRCAIPADDPRLQQHLRTRAP
jgi:serine/threonine-protein kinase